MSFTHIHESFRVVVDADIFAPRPDGGPVVIAHGVNTRGMMGGFAAQIDRWYPTAAKEYRDAVASLELRPNHTLLSVVPDRPLVIAHLVTQVDPGADASFDKLQASLGHMYEQIGAMLGSSVNGTAFSTVDIRMPLIGGGIGGLHPEAAFDGIVDQMNTSMVRVAGKQVASSFVEGLDGNVTTTLYLRSEDPHTERLLELYREVPR